MLDNTLINEFFDYNFYNNKYSFFSNFNNQKSINHYLKYGKYLPYSPNENLCAISYFENNLDVINAVFKHELDHPVQHYLYYAYKENRKYEPVSTTNKNKLINSVSKNITSSKIAIVIYVYYEDYIELFSLLLSNYKIKFDLFVVSPILKILNKYKEKFSKECSHIRTYYIHSQNRGRNFGPILVELSKNLIKYDIIGHVHTKKSLYTGNSRYDLALNNISAVLGSPEYVDYVISILNSDLDVGLIYSRNLKTFPKWANHWILNYNNCRKWAEKLNICLFDDTFIDYPVGGMFWARTEAIENILKYSWKYGHFPEESGQTDGTTQHAIERLIGQECIGKKFKIVVWDNYSSSLVYDYKIIKNIECIDEESLNSIINIHDVISFDIFDTLVCREITSKSVRSILDLRYNNYSEMRRISEIKARKLTKKGDVNINDIAKQLCKIMNIDINKALMILSEELDIEINISHPRLNIIKLLEYSKNIGKRIVYTSDMYYGSDEIKKILLKCNLPLPDKFYISSEVNFRKDNLSLWAFIKQNEIGNILHFGDNIVSDLSNAGWHHIDNIYTPSIVDKARLLGILNAKLSDEEYDVLFRMLYKIDEYYEYTFV